MRVSLIGGLLLGLILPLITLPLSWHIMPAVTSSIEKPLNLIFLNLDSSFSLQNPENSAPGKGPASFWVIFGRGLAIIYLSVVVFKLFHLSKKIHVIHNSIRNNPGEKKGKYWFIYLESPSAAFSFFNYIFISMDLGSMSSEEIERIRSHEIIHAKEYHTADIMFIELVSVLFWFNPLIRIFKEYLQEVHEYSADEKILKNREMKQSYSNLLLKLSSKDYPTMLSSAFSVKQVSRRILMMGKTRSLPRYRLSFLLFLPVAAFLLASFSSVENGLATNSISGEDQTMVSPSRNQMKVGVLNWINNTLYTDAQLNEKLGIKSGDAYSKEYLEQRLYLDIDALSSLYLDKGYLFFKADYQENPKEDGLMNLTITIYEGVQCHVRNITIEGNGSVPKADVLKEIVIQTGELFSRKKLIQSVHAIRDMGLFDPESILVNPTPREDEFDGEFGKVDIEFVLTQK